MDVGGSVPDPLLPAAIALQNPELLMGQPFYVLPELDRIVVMVDSGGEELRGLGKHVDYLVFDDDGHDVLKLPNRARCYEAIVDFFREHLAP